MVSPCAGQVGEELMMSVRRKNAGTILRARNAIQRCLVLQRMIPTVPRLSPTSRQGRERKRMSKPISPRPMRLPVTIQ
jgi:hypothetical protein